MRIIAYMVRMASHIGRGALAVLLVVSVAANIYLGLRVRTLENPAAAAAAELAGLVKDVSVVMVLPQDETPTTATVTDPSKLRDQPFFANAEEGDKVLIYEKSRKAILWRPSTHKVIEVSGLNAASAPAVPAR